MFFLGTDLSEGSAIDGDDGALDESLGSDKLVVRRVVDNVDDSALSGSGLGSPGEGSLNSRVKNLKGGRIITWSSRRARYLMFPPRVRTL